MTSPGGAVSKHGPRQSGKTTLARIVGEPRAYRYVSFDDEPTLNAAIDKRRTPGRYILTGSANVLLVPRLADSLAGRVGMLRLHLLAQTEVERAQPRFIDALFAGSFRTGIAERLGSGLARRVVAGGYPAALARATAASSRLIAGELVKTVRANVTIDWTVRENVRAQLRVLVKRILRKYGYPQAGQGDTDRVGAGRIALGRLGNRGELTAQDDFRPCGAMLRQATASSRVPARSGRMAALPSR